MRKGRERSREAGAGIPRGGGAGPNGRATQTGTHGSRDFRGGGLEPKMMAVCGVKSWLLAVSLKFEADVASP